MGIWGAFFSGLAHGNRHHAENLLFLIPLFPLVGFLLNGVLGKRFGKGLVSFIAVGAAFAAFLWAAACVGALGSPEVSGEQYRNILHDSYGTWVSVGDFSFNFGLMIDSLSATMILIVTGIGTLITLYSVGYMGEDPGFSRFMAYLNLFLFAMILLVLGDNLVMLFVGWEGVGLCSYLLIGFWYEEAKNASAGMKAFVVNRIGDLGFMLGMFALVATFGTLNFFSPTVKVQEFGARATPSTYVAESGTVTLPKHAGLLDYADGIRMLNPKPAEHHAEHGAEHGVEHPKEEAKKEEGAHGEAGPEHAPSEATHGPKLIVGEKLDPAVSNLDLSKTKSWGVTLFEGKSIHWVLTFACILLFVGAMGKSAQIPLYVWLPDAMAGPTPVSALIHAATMVTAGVYMVCRLHGLFSVSEEALMMVACIGAATALFSALIGLTQLDIKKVLAYSTVSQLGYMFVGAGVGAFSLGIFHVVTHAFFKAQLFLGSGSVIHGMSGEQDMRKMGGLRKFMPITYVTMMIGALALAGMPLLAGWWSKDNIMAVVLGRALAGDGGIYWVLYIAIAVGAFCTAFYTFRMMFLTFYGENRADDHVQEHIHESPWTMTAPLIILAALSLLGGLILQGSFVPHESGYIPGGPGLYNLLPHEHALHLAHTINFWVALVGFLAGVGLACTRYAKGQNVPKPEASTNVLYKASLNKFYVDEIYGVAIIGTFRIVSEIAHWVLELLIIDLLVTGTGYAVRGISGLLRKIQTGLMNEYAGGVLVGALALLLYLLI
jgi:NADH-quinone oxidoreductase subunit L